MMYALDIRIEAQTEFDDAAIWYECRQEGLGIQFVEEVDRVLSQLAGDPDRLRCVWKDIRIASLQTFPYCIYYRIRPDRVRVIAILHGARDPRIWKSRTADN